MESSSNKGLQILQQAQGYYRAFEPLRRERERNKRYNYGDQWSDIIEVDGRRITEEQYIKEQGSIPLKNNLIRRLVRNVIGIYNSRTDQPVCVARDPAETHLARTMTALLRYNMQLNRSSALYTRSLEEFLISGFVVHKKTFGLRSSRPDSWADCWTDYVQPNNFFTDTLMRDFRGWDCRCVGEVHKVTFAEVCHQFASDHVREQWLRCQFGAVDDASLCEITEVWRLESSRYYLVHDPLDATVRKVDAADTAALDALDAENAVREAAGQPTLTRRWVMHDLWRYYFIAPSGVILAQGDSPYAHKGHPYVFKAYPMIDGEIHSFVADVIDQQRHTNRLITLYDWIMRASSKGVLLVPEDCIPRGCSPDDFAEAWSRYNGVIVYKPSVQGAVPQQVANNSTDIGIRQLLDIQLKFFEDISGVNNALQGKSSNVGMSAELYGQQTLNATTTLLDVLDTFNEFVRDCAFKDMQLIRQYYTSDRIRQIVGADACLDGIEDVALDLNISPDLTSPSAKAANNALLMEIWKSGQISLQQMLRAGNFDFADALLQESLSEGGSGDGLTLAAGH